MRRKEIESLTLELSKVSRCVADQTSDNAQLTTEVSVSVPDWLSDLTQFARAEYRFEVETFHNQQSPEECGG